MLAPFAKLRSVAQRAGDQLKTVEALVEEASERLEEADDADAEEAREAVEDEYEPLMASQHSVKSNRSGRTREESGRRSLEEDPTSGTRVRKLEMTVTYLCFFVLGATILLPWNVLIVVANYFHSRLIGSPYAESFTSWVSLTFTSCNLIFLAHANSSQKRTDVNFRIFVSVLLIIAALVVLLITTRIEFINSTVFFVILILSTIIEAAGASYLQNAVVALSSLFGPSYLQGILSGQGAIGAGVSVVQFLSALTASSPPAPSSKSVLSRVSSFSVLSFLMPTLGEPPEEAVFAPLPGDKDPLKDYADKLQLSAFIFFLIATIFAIVALICHILIVRMPYFRLTLKSAEADDDHYDDEGEENDDEGAGRDGRDSSTKGSGKKSKGHTSIFSIERKIRGFGLSVFWVFFVTLSVFPAITSSVLSVNDGPGASPILQPVLFVPLGFIVFNVGDWIGRVLPAIQMFILRSKKGLIIASLARTLFIPLFLLCNVSLTRPPVIASDIVFMILLLAFAMSNGYISTLIMIVGVAEPSLEKNEIDVAATCLAFYLTAGLAFGALASFGVRASICHCNPFINS